VEGGDNKEEDNKEEPAPGPAGAPVAKESPEEKAEEVVNEEKPEEKKEEEKPEEKKEEKKDDKKKPEEKKKKEISIKIISVSGVKKGGRFSSVDPQVFVNYNNNVKKSKELKWKKEIKVDETMKYTHKEKVNRVKIRLMDKGMISDTEIGHANYDMTSVIDSGECKTETLTMED